MTIVKEITHYLEQLAPLSYQESYDNAGLIVGNTQTEVTGVLLTLDSTEAVVEEAIAKGCNLIVAHHPIVFKGLKKLNGRNYVERTIIKAIKNDIAIYAIHTNLDHVMGGVNSMIAERLQLQKVRILAPKSDTLLKLVSFVPTEVTQAVLDALYEAGVGAIGNYDHCSFRVNGTGTFRPNEMAKPFIGRAQNDEEVIENRIEVIFPAHLQGKVLNALKQAHPYEEVAYYISALKNLNQEVGAGAIGELPKAMTGDEFLTHLKFTMGLQMIRHTALVSDSIKKVAVCGGAGGFLLNDAIGANADVFVTADYKYHEFFDADGQILICDVGHYESEVYTKELLQRYLSKKFVNFATILSETNTNPVFYRS
ncbi:Nif3-like dinuclear metal center hexameric protein [Runella sp. CRIBMP]|uniref:Nif3-like dinuclear metal center hexameric protein n=1 Tax=Runella sp. CRIBMP TaxID=2683261 RepID=UPI0014122D23|nr:Nif3-like dinuclear metal center hexameric protein [Runella sp. CRIBMP]NBB19065.1 Nif3-like dinuclear metal center hexameric protein [Runella sp. CRIBMP]